MFDWQMSKVNGKRALGAGSLLFKRRGRALMTLIDLSSCWPKSRFVSIALAFYYTVKHPNDSLWAYILLSNSTSLSDSNITNHLKLNMNEIIYLIVCRGVDWLGKSSRSWRRRLHDNSQVLSSVNFVLVLEFCSTEYLYYLAQFASIWDRV